MLYLSSNLTFNLNVICPLSLLPLRVCGRVMRIMRYVRAYACVMRVCVCVCVCVVCVCVCMCVGVLCVCYVCVICACVCDVCACLRSQGRLFVGCVFDSNAHHILTYIHTHTHTHTHIRTHIHNRVIVYSSSRVMPPLSHP